MADKKISQLTASTTPLAGTEVLPIVQSGVTKQVSVANLTAGRAVAASTLTTTGGAAIGGATLDNGVGRLIVDSTGFSYGITATANDQSAARIRIQNTGSGGGDYAFIAGENNVGNTGLTLFKVGVGTKLALDDGSDNFKIYGGNLVIGTAGKGIDFSADPSAAGMTSELLDDYEEGTWTPTLAFTSGSVTYVTQLGTYTKIGNQVTVNYWIRVNTVSSPSGATYVASLPFNSGATGTRPAAAIRVNNFAITGYCVGWLSTSTNQILLNDIQSGNAVTIDGSKVVGNTEIGGSFTYLVA